ncbi:MAG: hypothetical protein Q4P14_06095, partial [Methanobacteriaceae archaeon]|nr:hypothetical protein [Methanobacteriaceae archaeon]
STMGWTSTTSWNSTGYPPTYGINYYSQQVNSKTDGSGKKWVYQVKNGRKCLKYYCPSYYVENSLTYEGMYYMDFNIVSNQTPYFSDNGKKTTSTLTTYTIEGIPGGKSTKGTKFTPTTATSDGVYVQLDSYIEKVTDGKNYLNSFFSIDADKSIYAKDEEYNGTAPTSSDPTETITIPDQQFYDVYYTTGAGKLQTNTVKGTSVSYKTVKIDNDTTTNLSTYCNNASSNIAGESVYHGGGMPILATNTEDQEVKVGIKLSASSNVSCEVKISDKQFTLGSVPIDGTLLASGTITTNAADYTEFTFVVPKKGNVWLFLKNVTNDIPVTIEEITI